MLSRRLKPSFLIIGGVKCGTTSLFRYLIEHPDVLPGRLKEPAFFNNKNLLKALARYPKYLRNFPKKKSQEASVLSWPILTSKGQIVETTLEKSRSGKHTITGDASATYNFMANPWVVKSVLPQAKLIFLLRNPTDRFISHWRMFQRFDQEGRSGYNVGDLLPFVQKEIDAFNQRLATRIIHQGLYFEIIKKWERHFSPENLLIVLTKDLQNPETAHSEMRRITEYLELEPFDYSSILLEKFNVAPLADISKEAISSLDEFYKEANQTLKDQMQIDFEATRY